MSKFLVFSILASIFSCKQIAEKNGHLKAVVLKNSLPIVGIEELQLYFYQDFKIYGLPRLHSNFMMLDSNGVQISKLVGEYKTYDYFICREGDSMGFRFRSLDDSLPKRLSIDSLFKRKPSLNLHRNAFVETLIKKYKLITGISDSNKIRRDVYVPLKSGLERLTIWEYPDSIYLSFSKNKEVDIPFSFSILLDSIYHAKLSKIELIYNSNDMKSSFFEKEAKKISYEISPFAVKNEQEMVHFINRVKNKWYQGLK